jgi:hypothetical protein
MLTGGRHADYPFAFERAAAAATPIGTGPFAGLAACGIAVPLSNCRRFGSIDLPTGSLEVGVSPLRVNAAEGPTYGPTPYPS